MARTYKRCSVHGIRGPRGRRQAIVQKIRRKSIPADPWDDEDYCKTVEVPFRVAKRMYRQGWEPGRIIRRLKRKFRLSDFEAEQLVQFIYNWARLGLV